MLHPFERLDPRVRKRMLVTSLALTLLATAGMGFLDVHYRTPAAAQGIVSFEMAGNPMIAQMILDSWSRTPGTNLWVAFGLGADYLYLVIYGLTFALAAATIAARLQASSPGLARIARVVAFLQFVAPVCDALENAGLFAMLLRYGTDPWAAVSSGFALVKFACLGMALTLFLIAGPLAWRAKPVVAA